MYQLEKCQNKMCASPYTMQIILLLLMFSSSLSNRRHIIQIYSSPVISKIVMGQSWINNVVDKQHEFIVSM